MPRHLLLPNDISGKLWLSGMPGRYEPLGQTTVFCAQEKIDGVVCLVSDRELEEKSKEYHEAMRSGVFDVPVERFPIPDYGLPENVGEYFDFARATLDRLRQGQRLLLHCAAGCGRTGTFAAAVLIASGMNVSQALVAVKASGSFPDTPEQERLLEQFPS